MALVKLWIDQGAKAPTGTRVKTVIVTAPPANVPAGGSCTVDVAFNPQTTGMFKATIQIDLNPGPPVVISVSGHGT